MLISSQTKSMENTCILNIVHEDIIGFFSCAPLVLSSLKSVHETLSLERQKLQEAWEAHNLHQSDTLAVVQ